MAGFILINAFIDNVLRPKFLGKEFDMSILLVFVSLLFWGWVLGAIGAILGVPLTMVVKRIIEFMQTDDDEHPPEKKHVPPKKPAAKSSADT